MTTLMGTEKGLKAMATQPASRATINGVRIDAVALAISGKPPSDISDDEERIARYVRRVGDKLRTQGWLPDLRHKRMLDTIVREASLCAVPEAAGNACQTSQDDLSGVLGGNAEANAVTPPQSNLGDLVASE